MFRQIWALPGALKASKPFLFHLNELFRPIWPIDLSLGASEQVPDVCSDTSGPCQVPIDLDVPATFVQKISPIFGPLPGRLFSKGKQERGFKFLMFYLNFSK